MIFKYTWPLIVKGTKTQTRRIVKSGEHAQNSHGFLVPGTHWDQQIDAVFTDAGYKKWQRRGHYAVQQGRGRRGLFEIKIMRIDRESLNEISGDDARAEGFDPSPMIEISLQALNAGMTGQAQKDAAAIKAFSDAWDQIHTTKGSRWTDNPQVWVLTFEIAHL